MPFYWLAYHHNCANLFAGEGNGSIQRSKNGPDSDAHQYKQDRNANHHLNVAQMRIEHGGCSPAPWRRSAGELSGSVEMGTCSSAPIFCYVLTAARPVRNVYRCSALSAGTRAAMTQLITVNSYTMLTSIITTAIAT